MASRPAARRARAAEAAAADDAAAAAPPPALPPLTAEMRRATRRAHHAANAIILAKLAVALHDRQTYGRALASFYPVYKELERLLALHQAHAVLGGVARAALPLARAGAMEADLAFLIGGSGDGDGGGDGDDDPSAGAEAKGDGGGELAGQRRRRVPPAPAAGWRWAASASASAQDYALHLRALSDEDPALLIPYAWSLYVPVALGFLGRRVANGLGLPPPLSSAEGAGAGPAPAALSAAAGSPSSPLPSVGVRFFDLRATAGLDGAEALARLRAAVDSVAGGMSAVQRARVVAEACEQFRRNNAVVLEFPLGARDVWRAAAGGAGGLRRLFAFFLVLVVVFGVLMAGLRR